jgi:hypothetical protein
MDEVGVGVGGVAAAGEDVEDGNGVARGEPVDDGDRERKGCVVAVRGEDENLQVLLLRMILYTSVLPDGPPTLGHPTNEDLFAGTSVRAVTS